ncbi:MAG: hypothetical protein J6B48_02330 [Clostridia bacterium]|nr:hypothetical protein [Clostridia bacterium]
MIYDPGELTTYRTSDGNAVKIEYYRELPSTVELAKEYALAGKPDRYVVFAEKQQASNILGSKFSDGELESGVFMSIILRPSFFPSQAGLLGPLAATALVGAFEEHTTKTAGIGWVSSIIYEGKKIGGVSIEGKLNDYSSYEYMIVSFALKLDSRFFSPRLTDIIRKVFDDENPSVSMLVARTILNKFFKVYMDIKNPSKHMDYYKQKFCYYGKKVRYFADGKRHTGKIVDVDKKNCVLHIADKKGNTLAVTSPSGIIIQQKSDFLSFLKDKLTKI